MVVLRLLIGNSLASILQIDDAAPCKAVFGKRALHGEVVAVGIDFDIPAKREAIIKAEGCHSAAMGCDGNSVNDGIRCRIDPLSLVYLLVCGIGFLLIIEHSNERPLHLTNVATAALDIIGDEFS